MKGWQQLLHILPLINTRFIPVWFICHWFLFACAIWQFGDSQKLRLVRILRSTVMVRVGGGWVALDEFLVKNDPCRGRFFTRIFSVVWPYFFLCCPPQNIPFTPSLHYHSLFIFLSFFSAQMVGSTMWCKRVHDHVLCDQVKHLLYSVLVVLNVHACITL